MWSLAWLCLIVSFSSCFGFSAYPKVVHSPFKRCVVLTESTHENLRCIPAWDLNRKRLLRLMPTPNPVCHADTFWPNNSVNFGEIVIFHETTVPTGEFPHCNNDVFGEFERQQGAFSSKDVYQLLEPHAARITGGGLGLGLSHSDYIAKGTNIESMFLIKAAGEAEITAETTGRLVFSCESAGLAGLPVTSVAQKQEGPGAVPAGSLVLLGLARPWDGGRAGHFSPRRCYLTVMGIIPPEHPHPECFAKAEVVKLSRRGGVVVQDCDVYIGRRVARGGWDLPQSKWHNPFVARDSTREARAEVVAKYEEYVTSRPELLRSLHELRGRRLGCWCKSAPDVPCHGDVLLKLLEQQVSVGCSHISYPSEGAKALEFEAAGGDRSLRE